MMVAKVKWKVVRMTGYAAKSQYVVPNLQSSLCDLVFLTEAKRREDPFVEQDNGGAEGDPDAAKRHVNRLFEKMAATC